MPFVEVKTVVQGDIRNIWDIVSDMSSYPSFMPSLVSVDIEERTGNTTISKWVSNVDGRIISWREKDTFLNDQYRIEYHQVSGDLKKFEGYWQLSQTEEGVSIVLTVDFDMGIPMVSTLLNPLLKKKVRENSEGMLASIKALLEKKN